MKIMESAENYLETILVLSNKGDKVRSIDIVTETGYTKPSISRAVKSLKESGYISVDVHGYIDLLPSGRAIAEKIYERHRFLSKYLMKPLLLMHAGLNMSSVKKVLISWKSLSEL